MTQQSAHTDSSVRFQPCFRTKRQYVADNPAFTIGGIDWLIFHKREELLAAQAIAYFGSKILIIPPNFNLFILSGETREIGGCANA
jgi:hypothetical protein